MNYNDSPKKLRSKIVSKQDETHLNVESGNLSVRFGGFALALLSCLLLSELTSCSGESEPIPYEPKVDAPFDEEAWDSPLRPAVVTVQEVLDGERPVLEVVHDAGPGGWQFLDGEDLSYRDAVAVEKSQILKTDQSLESIIDLPVGWVAKRESKDAEWVRTLAADSAGKSGK